MNTTKDVVLVFPKRNEVVLRFEEVTVIEIPLKDKLLRELGTLVSSFKSYSFNYTKAVPHRTIETMIRTIRHHNNLIIETCELLDTLGSGGNRVGLSDAVGAAGLNFFKRLRSVQMYQTYWDSKALKRKTLARKSEKERTLSGSVKDIFQLGKRLRF